MRFLFYFVNAEALRKAFENFCVSAVDPFAQKTKYYSSGGCVNHQIAVRIHTRRHARIQNGG